MARDHSKFSFERGKRSCRKQGQCVIFVEGRNTEDSYIKLLKKTCCKVIPVVQRGHGIASCVDFVNEAEKKFLSFPRNKRDGYEEIWVVFDYDGHEDFREAVLLARKKGFKVAFSSMCIEYWFLLHFENHDGASIPMYGQSHSMAQIKLLNNHIRKYNKGAKSPVKEYDSGSKCVQEDFFDLMFAVNPETRNRRIEDAFNRAFAIHQRKLSIGAETQESVTTIYQLLISLGLFVKDKAGNYVLSWR